MWRSVKRKVLFPDVSARGAFYALTQLLCGCYLLGSLAILMFGFCGVSLENMAQLRGLGMAGFAVVSAIFATDDAEKAAGRLRSEADEILGLAADDIPAEVKR